MHTRESSYGKRTAVQAWGFKGEASAKGGRNARRESKLYLQILEIK